MYFLYDGIQSCIIHAIYHDGSDLMEIQVQNKSPLLRKENDMLKKLSSKKRKAGIVIPGISRISSDSVCS